MSCLSMSSSLPMKQSPPRGGAASRCLPLCLTKTAREDSCQRLCISSADTQVLSGLGEQTLCQGGGLSGQGGLSDWQAGTKARAGRRRSGDKPRPLGPRFQNPEDGFPESVKDEGAPAGAQRILDGSGGDAATKQRCRRSRVEVDAASSPRYKKTRRDGGGRDALSAG